MKGEDTVTDEAFGRRNGPAVLMVAWSGISPRDGFRE